MQVIWRWKSTYNDPNTNSLDDHKPDPLRRGRVGTEEGEEAHANDNECPANEVRGAVAACCLHDCSRDDSERGADECEREELGAGSDGASALTCLEEYWKII